MTARLTMDSFPADLQKAVGILYRGANSTGVPETILELAHLRASQINGCSACVDSGSRSALKKGETTERLMAVAAWREATYFSEAERAVLALTESATRLADRGDAVPDAVWAAAAGHFTDEQMASIVVWIATTNFFNRINATIHTEAPVAWG